jgi:hypothetical protein
VAVPCSVTVPRRVHVSGLSTRGSHQVRTSLQCAPPGRAGEPCARCSVRCDLRARYIHGILLSSLRSYVDLRIPRDSPVPAGQRVDWHRTRPRERTSTSARGNGPVPAPEGTDQYQRPSTRSCTSARGNGPVPAPEPRTGPPPGPAPDHGTGPPPGPCWATRPR